MTHELTDPQDSGPRVGAATSQRLAEPCLFLSHAGVDSEAAVKLAERIEAAGLKVWIDKSKLAPGTPWQDQLEDAVNKHSTAFLSIRETHPQLC